MKAKQESEQRLLELETQAKNKRDKMEMELEMRMQERELEIERKKAEADEERRQLEIEQRRGNSRASGSIANDVESHGSSKKQGYTKDWIQELPDPNYTPPALSPKIAVDLPKKTFPQVEKDKRLQTFFRFPEAVEQAAGEPRFPIVDVAGHQEVEKPKLALRTEQRKHSPEKTFQQQGPSKQYSRNRDQSPRHHSRNQPAESPDRNKGHFYPQPPQIIYQQNSGSSGLPKIKLPEFSGDPLAWPEWSGLFEVVVHQKSISDTEKMQHLKMLKPIPSIAAFA